MHRLMLILSVLVAPGSAIAAGIEAEAATALANVSGTQATPAAAQDAWRQAAESGPDGMFTLLASMKGATPTAQNWLRAAVDAIAERQLASGGELPVAKLEQFVNDQSQAPRARRTAFEWLTQVDPTAKPRLLSAMLNDPSLSLRYDAVDAQFKKLTETPEPNTSILKQLLTSARDLKQIEAIKEELEKSGEKVDLPGLLGFLKNWRVLGPFDNTQMKHFETSYPPEEEPNNARDFTKAYAGKAGEINWKEVTAGEEEGFVDLLEPLGKEPESVAYAYTTFFTKAGEYEVRYQSKNATRVWINGELVASNEVYHSGGGLDQYRAKFKFVEGENAVLVKVCQNEQKMPWETDWNFRLRIVDKVGTPVASQQKKLAADDAAIGDADAIIIF